GNFTYDFPVEHIKEIDDNNKTEVKEDVIKVEISPDSVLNIPINDVIPNPDQPRKQFNEEALQELALSVKEHGILQPILVEEYAPSKFMIIAGERRYKAAQIAGLTVVPVLVKNFSLMQKLEVALIENVQRENLNSIEEAQAFHYLISKSGMTQEEVAKKVGKQRSTVANSLRLLQLPEDIQDEVIAGTLSAGHARAILSLVNPSDRFLLKSKIIENNLSVRQAEVLAEQLNEGKKIILKKKTKQKDSSIQLVEDKFLNVFKTRVELKGNLKRGKIEIPYTSSQELERLYSLLSKDELFE
ncbi:MAG: ParB/RepB/Spo0J family partition protein, partial [Spirochaetales bacterium]|nr:ParB/RepB/Spo0J family partition protein [Spirochaetales bacterium]